MNTTSRQAIALPNERQVTTLDVALHEAQCESSKFLQTAFRIEPACKTNKNLRFQLDRLLHSHNQYDQADAEQARAEVLRLISHSKHYSENLNANITNSILNTEHSKTTKNDLSKLLKCIYLFQLNYELATFETLLPAEYNQTEKNLNKYQQKINSLAEKIMKNNPGFETQLALRELITIPDKIRALKQLSIYLDYDFKLKSGDRISHFGLILLSCKNSEIEALQYDHGSHLHKTSFPEGNLKSWCSRKNLRVMRGGHMNYFTIGDSPHFNSSLNGLVPRVPVINKANTALKPEFECGRVIGYGKSSHLEVLWANPDSSVEIRSVHFKALKHYHSSFRSWGQNLLEAALSANSLSILDNFDQHRPKHPDFKIAHDPGYAIYKKIKNSTFAITLHIIRTTATTNEMQVLNKLKNKVAIFSEADCSTTNNSKSTLLPNYSADLIRQHYAIPVVLVLNQNLNHEIINSLIIQKNAGFEVVLINNTNSQEIDMIAKLYNFEVLHALDLKEFKTELIKFLKKQSQHASDSYNPYVFVKQSNLITEKIINALDNLAEQRPDRAISKIPEALAALKLSSQELLSTEQTVRALSKHEQITKLSGTTKIRSQWSHDDLSKLAEKLNKSALPANHPAVALRGVILKDKLTTTELEQQLQNGAIFITLENEQNEIEGLIITYTPQVLDKLRPNLSKELGREGKIGYVYWIWNDPDSELAASYGKLVNTLMAQQLTVGANYIFGRALERNIQSIRAALTVAGFNLVESECLIDGEPSVGLGFDFEETNASKLDARQVLNETLEVFAKGSNQLKSYDQEKQLQKRIQETLSFIQAEYNLISACQDLKTLLSVNPKLKSVLKFQNKVSEALLKLKDYLNPDVYDHAENLMITLIVEEKREQSILELNELVKKAIPETKKELKRRYQQLINHLQEYSLNDLPNQPSNADSLLYASFQEWAIDHSIELRPDSIQVPPPAQIQKIISMYEYLSETTKTYLTRWNDDSSLWLKISWPKKDHEIIHRAQIEQGLAEWIESSLERTNYFIYPRYNGDLSEFTEFDQQYLKSFNMFLQWYNETAREGHLNSDLGLYAKHVINAYLQGKS